MKNIDIVLNYIKSKITKKYIADCINNDTIHGITAEDIQNDLNIVRNNASTILNKLWKSSKLIKINSKPVSFLPRDIILSSAVFDNSTIKNTYTSDEIKKFIKKIKLNDDSIFNDPFQYLIGNDGSLANQISKAKAAIIYPPKGLHTLILGESGVGKTTFAYAMHEFGKSEKNLPESDFPFITFNCSDYYNNPELLLSQLFGHIKGAFTGADTDKIGLVEKANGGILFLDEIHSLPATGQEMLFYLMDKGEFHRLGETNSNRKSNVLIIAATTEKPDRKLLSTFIRRIPVIINLPPFREKSIGERIEIIQNAFSYESKNLNKKIRISPQVLRALALYPFRVGNIGQLRSEIKLLCAKSFLEHLKNDQELTIKFEMLDKNIRDNILSYTYDNDKSTKAYLDMFTEDMIVSPIDNEKYYPAKPENELYKLVVKTFEDLKLKGISKDLIELEAKTLAENKMITSSLNSKRLSISQLYKFVPKNIIDSSIELTNIAQNELSTKFSSKFIIAFALHIQSLLARIANGKTISNPNMLKIKKNYPKEFDVSKKLVNLLSQKFGVMIPRSENSFLTILLANNKIDKTNEDKIKIFVMCHGYSTATSMADVANTLLNSDLVTGIDMPIDMDISKAYSKFKSEALKSKTTKGIFLLADMGSLLNFGDTLMKETGLVVKTISNVSTLLVIETLRNVLYKDSNIDEIFNFLINKDLTSPKQKQLIEKKAVKRDAILTFCATGQGASMIAKNILTKILSNKYKDKFEIITTNYADAENGFNDLKSKYNIIAVIGSYDPKANIPYFPISKLLNTSSQNEFLKFLDANNVNNKDNGHITKSIYEISKETLEQYVKYVNPSIAVINIKKFLNALELDISPQNQNNVIDLIIHLGCMLDRCIHGDFVKFENIDEYKVKNISQFNKIHKCIHILEDEYDININDDEICYIIKIISRWQ